MANIEDAVSDLYEEIVRAETRIASEYRSAAAFILTGTLLSRLNPTHAANCASVPANQADNACKLAVVISGMIQSWYPKEKSVSENIMEKARDGDQMVSSSQQQRFAQLQLANSMVTEALQQPRPPTDSENLQLCKNLRTKPFDVDVRPVRPAQVRQVIYEVTQGILNRESMNVDREQFEKVCALLLKYADETDTRIGIRDYLRGTNIWFVLAILFFALILLTVKNLTCAFQLVEQKMVSFMEVVNLELKQRIIKLEHQRSASDLKVGRIGRNAAVRLKILEDGQDPAQPLLNETTKYLINKQREKEERETDPSIESNKCSLEQIMGEVGDIFTEKRFTTTQGSRDTIQEELSAIGCDDLNPSLWHDFTRQLIDEWSNWENEKWTGEFMWPQEQVLRMKRSLKRIKMDGLYESATGFGNQEIDIFLDIITGTRKDAAIWRESRIAEREDEMSRIAPARRATAGNSRWELQPKKN